MTRVLLGEVQACLSLFAEGIVGRSVSVAAIDDDRPWLDRVNGIGWNEAVVPLRIDEFGTSDQNRRAFRTVVLRQMTEMEERNREPLADELANRSELLTTIFSMVEGLRVDCVVRHRYPGASADLDQLLEAARSEALVGVVSPSDVLFLRLATLGAGSVQLAQVGVQVDNRLQEEMLHLIDAITVNGATRADSVAVAERLCTLFAERDLDPFSVTMASPDDPVAGEVEVAGGGSLDTAGTPTSTEAAEGLAGGSPLTDTDVAQLAQDGEKKRVGGLVLPSGLGAGLDASDRRSFLYDEWDYVAASHRRGWCRVIERRVVGDDHDFIADVRARHSALRNRIRRSFGQLRPADLVRVHRSDEGEEIDLDAALEAIADRRGGAPASERLHIRRERAARDVATAFLLDLSASTSAPVVTPEIPALPPADPADDILSYAPIFHTEVGPIEPVRRVIDVAVDAVALMGDSLHELGDRHAIYGFSGTGRRNVDFAIAKDFGDRVSAQTWASTAAMKPLQYTRMGPAVRHATAKLAAQPTRTRLLIVISDGYPQDTDYGDDRRDKDYGIHDTARALRDATNAGIDTFCVTIDPAGHDYLRRMCPDDRYLIIDEVEALPEELAKLYLTLSA